LKPAEQIEEGASAWAAVVPVQLQPLEKHEQASRSASRVLDMPSRSVSCRRNSATASSTARKIFAARAFSEGSDSRSGLQGAVGANQRSQRVAQVAVHYTRCFECRGNQRVAQEFQQLPVAFEQLFGNPDVAVGQILGIEGRGLLMFARVPQVFTIERARYRDLALGTATDGADVAMNAWAVATWSPRLADSTSIPLVYAAGDTNISSPDAKRRPAGGSCRRRRTLVQAGDDAAKSSAASWMRARFGYPSA